MTSIIVWLWWIYEVSNRRLICSIETPPNTYPTDQQLADNCPYNISNGLYFGEIEMTHFEITKSGDPGPFCVPPNVPIGSGMLETPPSAEGLWTDDPLLMLADRLRWYGRSETITEWQNLFNQDIYNAAISSGVPAHLLKTLIGVESQFWPLWTPSENEISMGQITDAGIDVLMRYDEAAFNTICNQAVAGCDRGYHIMSVAKQAMVRDTLRATLICHACSVDQAIEQERYNIGIYARVLRAYGCRNGWDWIAALKDYNGGDKYLERFGLGG